MFDIRFIDAGREPTQKPDHKYPNGMWVNLAESSEISCTKNLPYPAPRCGLYEITCRTCGYKADVTVAGRADDPNMITLPCKKS